MKLKRLVAASAAAVMALSAFTSCGTSIIKNEKISGDDSSSEGESAVTDLSSESDSNYDEESVAVSAATTETNFDTIEIPYTEYSETYQAESGTFTGEGATVKKDRASFKGDGYVEGANLENWSISFDLPESQFYNITVQTAADRSLNASLYVNGQQVWIFRTSGDGVFSTKNLENIWLEEGINEITIESTDDAVDIDYIKIEANSEISTLNPDLSNAELSNENADYNAKALYSLLCSDYGNQVLTAQHDTAGSLSETNTVEQVAGKSAAIRVSDIGGYTKGNIKDISKAEKYAEKGGIIAYDWYWIDPSGDESSTDIEITNTDFDITKAVPEKIEVEAESDDSYPDDLDEDQQSAGSQSASLTTTEEEYEISIEEMAMWSTEDIEYEYSIGAISEECYLILNDIDTISAKLNVLKKDGTAVIFRPLPVASNGLYWWGTDEEAYQWLWKLVYTRMTEYHDLSNLIWVWSAQNADWYVGDEYCDVLSVDVYTEGETMSAQINTLLFLNNICKTKPLAMSECSSLPAMESILQSNALWSYTALYSEPYLSAQLGLDEDEDTQSSLCSRFIEYYNNNYTLTLDELPNLDDVAESIKSEEQSSDEEGDE